MENLDNGIDGRCSDDSEATYAELEAPIEIAQEIAR